MPAVSHESRLIAGPMWQLRGIICVRSTRVRRSPASMTPSRKRRGKRACHPSPARSTRWCGASQSPTSRMHSRTACAISRRCRFTGSSSARSMPWAASSSCSASRNWAWFIWPIRWPQVLRCSGHSWRSASTRSAAAASWASRYRLARSGRPCARAARSAGWLS